MSDPKQMISIFESTYIDLLCAKHKLGLLELADVGNWDGYTAALTPNIRDVLSYDEYAQQIKDNLCNKHKLNKGVEYD